MNEKGTIVRAVILLLLFIVVLMAGCTILPDESQKNPVQHNGKPPFITAMNVTEGSATGNETDVEERSGNWSGGLLTDEELSLLFQRHTRYMENPEEIPILGDASGHPEWIRTDKMTIIRTVLSDEEAQEVIDDQGAVIGVVLSIHPTPKDSGRMGGPALRVFQRGVVTDYIVDESTVQVVEKVIGPVEVIPEIRNHQLNLG